MKLYAYRPEGFGPYSFFVMAESEEDAIKSIEQYIKATGFDSYFADDFLLKRSEEYELTVLDPGEVITNDNS